MAVFKCFQQLYWTVKIYRVTMHYTVYTDFMFCMEYLAIAEYNVKHFTLKCCIWIGNVHSNYK